MSDFDLLKLPDKIAGRVLKIASDCRRRRLGFQLLPATVLLQVPQRCSKQNLLQLLAYVKSHLQHRAADPCDLERYQGYREAQLLPFKGLFYQVKQASEKGIEISDDILYSPGQAEIKTWYYQQAQDYLWQRSAHFAAKMGLEAPQLETKSYRSRWGSCYAHEQHPYLIRYNWQLIQTPPEILDYVVVHELCHLLFFDHGPHFKRLLHHFFPAYTEAEQWLASHGAQLLLDNPFRKSL